MMFVLDQLEMELALQRKRHFGYIQLLTVPLKLKCPSYEAIYVIPLMFENLYLPCSSYGTHFKAYYFVFDLPTFCEAESFSN